MTRIDADFWQDRRVLVTGQTGLKGSWLVLWLARLGARVTGVALPSPTSPRLYEAADVQDACDSRICEVRDAAALKAIMTEASPEVVFPLASQSLVRASYRDPLGTFSTNVLGTANLLDSLRDVPSVRSAVIATTDKVYREAPAAARSPNRETDPLGGHDPNSASNAGNEIIVERYRQAFFADEGVALSTARADNVNGGGDGSEDRLIPYATRAWLAGGGLRVHRPDAVRPWQHVLEPLAGYLALARRTHDDRSLADAYNLAPSAPAEATVRDVVSIAHACLGKGTVVLADSPAGTHESPWLSLDSSKAAVVLGASSRWSLREAVERTVLWYSSHNDQKAAADLCHADITGFEAAV